MRSLKMIIAGMAGGEEECLESQRFIFLYDI